MVEIINKETEIRSIDRINTMYPSFAALRTDVTIVLNFYATLYLYVLEGTVTCISNGLVLTEGMYMCLPYSDIYTGIYINGTAFCVDRFGYNGQFIVGRVEKQGRVSYIDGCSDSILVCPPRKGDPCLNHLCIPPETTQSHHTHPTVRFGIITSGRGKIQLGKAIRSLSKGDMFCINPHEKHRFLTGSEGMDVVVYHPDSEWGPTDENHPMLNRTYIK